MEEKNFWQRNKGLSIAIIVVGILVLWTISSYNRFVSLDEQITGQWSQVENQYQRRFDLIPNIVSTVKGVVKQEKDIFLALAEARTRYSGAASIDDKARAAGAVESSLGRLLLIAENYPALQSSQSFRDLSVTLEGTENRISVERSKYNDLVRQFDTKLKTFPSSIVGSIFGMKDRAYFDVPKENQAVPKVDFTH